MEKTKKEIKEIKKKTSEEIKPKVEKERFAVIEISGSQLRVLEGKKYEVDYIEAEKGDDLTYDKVLLVVDGDDVILGKPYIPKAKVEVIVDSQKKGEKIKGLVYKAKSRYRKHYGHRSQITRLLVKKISI